MPVETVRVSVRTRGHTDILDLTGEVAAAVRRGHVRSGIVTVFVPGSTAGITTMEFERGLMADLATALERLAPEGAHYEHNRHDDNGYAHVRAAVLGASVTVPFVDGALLLGTWQQIVLVDLDTHGRHREVICQLIGD